MRLDSIHCAEHAMDGTAGSTAVLSPSFPTAPSVHLPTALPSTHAQWQDAGPPKERYCAFTRSRKARTTRARTAPVRRSAPRKGKPSGGPRHGMTRHLWHRPWSAPQPPRSSEQPLARPPTLCPHPCPCPRSPGSPQDRMEEDTGLEGNNTWSTFRLPPFRLPARRPLSRKASPRPTHRPRLTRDAPAWSVCQQTEGNRSGGR